MRIAAVSLGLKRRIHTDIECLRETEGVLPLERADRTVEFSLPVGSVSGVPLLLHAESELRLPDADWGSQCHHGAVRMGFWNDLIIYDGYTRMCFIIISLSNGGQTILHVLIPSTQVNPFP